MKAFAQCSLDFGKIVSNGFPDLEVWKHSIAREFVNVSQRQTAMSGDLVTRDLPGGEAGSGEVCCCRLCHEAQ